MASVCLHPWLASLFFVWRKKKTWDKYSSKLELRLRAHNFGETSKYPSTRAQNLSAQFQKWLRYSEFVALFSITATIEKTSTAISSVVAEGTAADGVGGNEEHEHDDVCNGYLSPVLLQILKHPSLARSAVEAKLSGSIAPKCTIRVLCRCWWRGSCFLPVCCIDESITAAWRWLATTWLPPKHQRKKKPKPKTRLSVSFGLYLWVCKNKMLWKKSLKTHEWVKENKGEP